MIFWNFRAAMKLEIERFFDSAFDAAPADTPKKSTFTKARAKLKASAFIELNEQLNHQFAGQCAAQNLQDRWRGLRLLGIDGSTLRLPNSEEVVDHFGGMQPKNGKFVPMARFSFLHDLLTNVTQAAVITSYHTGEGQHAWDLVCSHANALSCFIFDRGYFDGSLPFLMEALQTNFIVRVPVKAFAKAQQFVKSGKKECKIQLPVPDWIKEELKQCGVTFKDDSLTVRLVRVELNTGEVEVLMTNLLDTELYPSEEFDKVYHLRWNIEESYKSCKCKVEIENWSGRTVVSVEQDFHAGVLNLNLVTSIAFLMQPAIEAQRTQTSPQPEQQRPKAKNERRGSKHRYKVNIKRGLGVIRDHLCELLTSCVERTTELVERITGRLKEDLSLVRPGRVYPRNHRPPRIYAAPYKPIA